MCGIVGYVGSDQALPVVLEGLRRLEYRGYDSAGVAMIDGGLSVVKRAGKLSELDAALEVVGPVPGSIGMGHTRWATHGAPTDRNAHPHRDCEGRVAVIHNGIIENFTDLRTGLQKRGHVLDSDTDTEVVAHLIEEKEGSLADRVRATVGELDGAYALVVLALDEPDVIVGVRVSSPLIVGLGDGENLLASDIPAVLQKTRTVLPIDENQVVEVRAGDVRVTDLDGNEVEAEPFEVTWDVTRAQKGGFDDFMLKEIHEQPAAIRDTLVGRVSDQGLLALDELHTDTDVLREVDKVFVVACGTAFHSGLVAKYAPDAIPVLFGHIGEGNLHLNLVRCVLDDNRDHLHALLWTLVLGLLVAGAAVRAPEVTEGVVPALGRSALLACLGVFCVQAAVSAAAELRSR